MPKVKIALANLFGTEYVCNRYALRSRCRPYSYVYWSDSNVVKTIGNVRSSASACYKYRRHTAADIVSVQVRNETFNGIAPVCRI